MWWRIKLKKIDDEIEEEIDEYILLNKKEKTNKPKIETINYKDFEILGYKLNSKSLKSESFFIAFLVFK